MIMTLLPQQFTLDAVRWPTSTSRDLLASIHSGDVLRETIPKFLKIGAVIGFAVYSLFWLASWPGIYEELERWGLVKAFFAQLIVLGTVFLVVRITFLRAQHLATLPADDFVSLRAVAVLSRWLGEIVLVYVLGTGVGALLQPLGAMLTGLISALSPSAGAGASGGSSALLLMSVPLFLLSTSIAATFFLILYTVANTIDLGLAIEFNTRAERVGRRIS
jgi:hypothetical protein